MSDLGIIICIAFDHRASAEGLARFKECILRCSFVHSAIQVCGTFDLIAQGSCTSLAEYTEHMESVRPQLAEFVTRIETNFISDNLPCSSLTDQSAGLWLPCEGGRKHVDAKLIDKIVAEGDYMRVHVGDWNCLVHYTMQRLCDELSSLDFIKLHRSSLVRIKFIERVTHDERRWRARLLDGTYVTVAKSHVHQLLGLMGGGSSKRRVNPTNGAHANRVPSHAAEYQKKVVR